MARGAGGSVISSRLKQRATPEDSPLIHTVVLQARTSLPGDMKHTHTHGGDTVVIHRITHRHMDTHITYTLYSHTYTHTHIYIGV